MVHVLAEIETNAGSRDEFLQHFRRVVPIVRDEDGCIEYGPAVDAATEFSAAPRDNVVTVIEKWANVAALRAHLKAPHMDEYRKRAGHLIAKVTIRVLQSA